MYELPQWFKTYDLWKWGNFEAVYLRFHWLNDSWTCGFELITSEFELVTHGFDLIICGFELITGGFELVTREVELIKEEFWWFSVVSYNTVHFAV